MRIPGVPRVPREEPFWSYGRALLLARPLGNSRDPHLLFGGLEWVGFIVDKDFSAENLGPADSRFSVFGFRHFTAFHAYYHNATP